LFFFCWTQDTAHIQPKLPMAKAKTTPMKGLLLLLQEEEEQSTPEQAADWLSIIVQATNMKAWSQDESDAFSLTVKLFSRDEHDHDHEHQYEHQHEHQHSSTNNTNTNINSATLEISRSELVAIMDDTSSLLLLNVQVGNSRVRDSLQIAPHDINTASFHFQIQIHCNGASNHRLVPEFLVPLLKSGSCPLQELNVSCLPSSVKFPVEALLNGLVHNPSLQRLSVTHSDWNTQDADALFSLVAHHHLPNLQSIDLAHNQIDSIVFPSLLLPQQQQQQQQQQEKLSSATSSVLKEVNLYQNPCSFRPLTKRHIEYMDKVFQNHPRLVHFGWKRLYATNPKLQFMSDWNRSKVGWLFLREHVPYAVWPLVLEHQRQQQQQQQANHHKNNLGEGTSTERQASVLFQLLRESQVLYVPHSG
jgi:hypothetical protein